MTSRDMDDGASRYREPALARRLAILEAAACRYSPATAGPPELPRRLRRFSPHTRNRSMYR